MSDAQLYAPDYLRMQKDEQLHRIAEMIERMIERKSTLEQKLAKAIVTLNFYANGDHIMNESDHSHASVCPSHGHFARTTLAEIGEP